MKLYVIGNGFDIAHGLPCKFSDFYNFLKLNRQDVLREMEDFYYIESDSDLWSDFEAGLERDIIYDKLTETIGENSPCIASDDFRDRDWYNAQIQIEDDCDQLLELIRSGFEEWIRSLKTHNISPCYNIEEGAKFFTFNYTEILETVYKISTSDILHIHNKVGENLIFGHGKNSSEFNVKEALYGDEKANLTCDEFGNIESNEVGHEQFAESAVEAFYIKMKKDTAAVINHQKTFFDNLYGVNEVHVLGHSYNEIDFPYFEEIASSIKNNTNWFLSYFSDIDRESAEAMMQNLGVGDNFITYYKATND